jgi:hypothetical protein
LITPFSSLILDSISYFSAQAKDRPPFLGLIALDNHEIVHSGFFDEHWK